MTQPFVDYLRADGIVLPPDDAPAQSGAGIADDDSGIFSGESDSDEDQDADPSADWRDIHTRIRECIRELGGKVTPKLNWSAPKDATWISATNDMECSTANEVYLLLKSSDFITHDLEQAFDGCVDDARITEETADGRGQDSTSSHSIPYHLVLRKWFNLNPSLEFRCFVRNGMLIGLCQRDLNHFDFLASMRGSLTARIEQFFEQKLRKKFPETSFVFDVYVPPPHDRVWLIDINPWAVRTDPLLFSWLELLRMPEPTMCADDTGDEEEHDVEHISPDEDLPELRLVGRDDPEAYQFNTPRYSAHKMPKDVVDAAGGGVGGMKEMMDQWQKILSKQEEEDDESDADEIPREAS